MQNAKLRTVARYVIPAICSNVCFFLFTIVDAIFVGRGVGTNALGAINLAGPTILIVGAVNMLISIGGAAIATGISQTIGLLILLTRFARRQGNLRFGRTKLNARIFRDIVVHGLPEGISQLSNPVMTLCMNFVLIQRIGDLGVNAFSVISYIASFSMTAFLGASEGLQPLFGQSYGAKNEADLKYCLKTGLTISAVGSVLITGLSILLGKPICVLFGTDAATTEYIIKYLPPVCRWIYYHGSQCYDLGLLVFHGTFRFVHRHQYSAEPCDQFCCDLDSAPYFWRRGNLVLAAGL